VSRGDTQHESIAVHVTTVQHESIAVHVTTVQHESIAVHVTTVQHELDSLDPAPFRERDLDPKVEHYIVGWAREMPPRRPLELVVHLDQAASGDADLLQHAVREYFQQRAVAERRAMRHLLHIGRVSLAIGLAVLAIAMVLGDLLSVLVGRYAYGEIIAHSCSSAAGWRCGGRWRSSSTTGGPSAAMRGCTTG